MQADSPPGSHQLRREMGQYERDAAVIREFQALTIMQCVLLWLLSFVRHESGMHIWILYLNAFEMFEMPLFMQKYPGWDTAGEKVCMQVSIKKHLCTM